MTGAAAEWMGAWRDGLLAFLDRVREAVAFRDREALDGLLARDEARHLPRSVREEVMALVREPRDGFRAPVRLLHFAFAIRQLRGDEELARRASPQLELGLAHDEPAGPRPKPSRFRVMHRPRVARASRRDDDPAGDA